MMVTIDDETLARAVLTFCLDSADAMMYALVQRHRLRGKRATADR